jgi:hypothetical protein
MTTVTQVHEHGDLSLPPLKCPTRNSQTGAGYDKLTDRMKGALSKLNAILDSQGACYRFILGWRSQEYQDRLRGRWHRIADRMKSDKRTDAEICGQLRKAGFGQCPTAWVPPDSSGKRSAPTEKIQQARTSAESREHRDRSSRVAGIPGGGQAADDARGRRRLLPAETITL